DQARRARLVAAALVVVAAQQGVALQADADEAQAPVRAVEPGMRSLELAPDRLEPPRIPVAAKHGASAHRRASVATVLTARPRRQRRDADMLRATVLDDRLIERRLDERSVLLGQSRIDEPLRRRAAALQGDEQRRGGVAPRRAAVDERERRNDVERSLEAAAG